MDGMYQVLVTNATSEFLPAGSLIYIPAGGRPSPEHSLEVVRIDAPNRRAYCDWKVRPASDTWLESELAAHVDTELE